jgi:hypothetical protein
MFGGVTAVVMLVTGVNCFCSASRAIACNNDGHGKLMRPCCCQTDHDRYDSDQFSQQNKRNPGHSCPHCQGTLVCENSPVKNLTATFNYSTIFAVLPDIDPCTLAILQHPSTPIGAWPLQTEQPTLFGLHCALSL